MEIFIEKDNRTLRKRFRGKARNLLKDLKISTETVIVVRNNELVTEDETLTDNDRIKILSVISGG
jgi:sulfur carrier protein